MPRGGCCAFEGMPTAALAAFHLPPEDMNYQVVRSIGKITPRPKMFTQLPRRQHRELEQVAFKLLFKKLYSRQRHCSVYTQRDYLLLNNNYLGKLVSTKTPTVIMMIFDGSYDNDRFLATRVIIIVHLISY